MSAHLHPTWRRYGALCGYPKCCVEAFCIEFHSDRSARKLEGTGYVPCAACNEFSEAALIARINLNRDSRLPAFPNHSGLRSIAA